MSTGPKGSPPKQKKGTTKKGGRRPNSGPKYAKIVLPQDELAKLFNALDEHGRSRGESWHQNFAKHVFSEDWQEAAAFHRMLVGYQKRPQEKKPTGEPEEETKKPIGLPDMGIDPGKVTPIKKQA